MKVRLAILIDESLPDLLKMCGVLVEFRYPRPASRRYATPFLWLLPGTVYDASDFFKRILTNLLQFFPSVVQCSKVFRPSLAHTSITAAILRGRVKITFYLLYG